jgi:hypothetical protein
MIALEPLHQLPLKEKLLVMEALWNDLRQSDESIKVPQWHKDILNEREGRIASGEAKFTDWEEAKKEILAAVK